ncbi:MAG: dTDP-4-dehydrorhamnose 3,5-epimerase family protein [Elusimicrobia bacterium]|nr:dTDP-4-dehydrorhamnose 3,5-epimerase family protein [Elusimicrobiota bacterium]
MIEGVKIIDLATHSDERGFFRELMRAGDGSFPADFGQLSHSLVRPGVVKAWHFHKKQIQWNYAACGLLKVALYDTRPHSPTFGKTMEFLAGDDQPARVYAFPPGVAHGYKCLAGPAHIFYVTSGVYDPEGDEGRIRSDDPSIGYEWQPGEQKKAL